jgi:hypothetical protein
MKQNEQKPLEEIMMSNGKQTAAEWLKNEPKQYHSLATEAIYECLKRGWPLNVMEIQGIAREIDAQRNPKGW